MGKKWRPEGWENPHHKEQTIYDPGTDTFWYIDIIFEAGANAMLDALRKQTLDHEITITAIQNIPSVGLKTPTTPGMWVFVPDDEE